MNNKQFKTQHVVAAAGAVLACLCIVLSVVRMFNSLSFSLPSMSVWNKLSGASDGVFMTGSGDETPAGMAMPMVRHVIAVDPGHGGTDDGALGLNGMVEKDMTELTAQYLCRLIYNDVNYISFATRTEDECPTPRQRTTRATQAGAELFISIHGNSDGVGKNQGFEVYAAPPGRTYHDGSLAFAQKIVESWRTSTATIRGETGVLYNYYYEGSKNLATGYDRYAVSSTDLTEHPNLNSYGVLDTASCPSVLCEQCFMNTEADSYWYSDAGCREAAMLYYKAICSYFGTDAYATLD